MSDTVDCPYCEYENDMSDALCDGLSNDSKIDWDCQNCGEIFEVYVEFEPTYYSSKIERINCEICGEETRDIYEKGRVVPYPENIKEKRICHECFTKALCKEL
jgi:hypothetical protein